MATIKTAIQVYDEMSPSLKSIDNTLGVVINSFESLQNISKKAVDISNIKNAKEELYKLENNFKNIDCSIKRSYESQKILNNSIKEGERNTNDFLEKIKGVSIALMAIGSIKKGVEVVKDWLSGSDVQTRAEEQLKTIMKTRMGTVNIEPILDITAYQQKIGILGDEMQLMGVQQLATFLNSDKALAILIPAMNNLVAQQKGVNATNEDMIHTGNLMGKVMQGQVAALARNGITFTKAQEEVLKYGTEIEKATMLSQVITDNVGEMNKTLANTPAGKIKQIKNEWGDMKEPLGDFLYPAVLEFFTNLKNNMPLGEIIMKIFARGVIIVIEIFNVLLNTINKVYKFIEKNWANVSLILRIIGGAVIAIHCPLLFVICLFYKIIEIINKLAKTSISATGIIIAVFSLVFTHIYNRYVVPTWNLISNFANFFSNVFKHPVASVQLLFLNMTKSIIGYIKTIFKAIEDLINKIPGVKIDITSNLDNFKNKIEEKTKYIKTKNKIEEKFKELDYKDYNKVYKNSYEFGSKLKDKMFIDMKKRENTYNRNLNNFNNTEDILNKTRENTHNIAQNTKDIKTNLEEKEDLKYLRDIKEQELINRFTTTEIKINLGGIVNKVEKNTDLDGIVTYLEEKLYETMRMAAEGVHL